LDLIYLMHVTEALSMHFHFLKLIDVCSNLNWGHLKWNFLFKGQLTQCNWMFWALSHIHPYTHSKKRSSDSATAAKKRPELDHQSLKSPKKHWNLNMVTKSLNLSDYHAWLLVVPFSPFGQAAQPKRITQMPPAFKGNVVLSLVLFGTNPSHILTNSMLVPLWLVKKC
jgi:hypothetical protein